MIYVIKSFGVKDQTKELDINNLIEIIKIGFTEDSNQERRISSYSTHNKAYKVLLKIPEGTQEDEHDLHQYFKDFQYFDREWFIDVDDTIENFFKENSTIELIRSKIPRTRPRKRPIGFIREIRKRLNLIFPIKSMDEYIKYFKLKNS